MLKLARLQGRPEIFYSIQGEGRNMGRPSIFIRLSLCNLYCRWCDTDYTWNWKGTRFVHNNDELPGYKKFEKEEMIMMLANGEILDILQGFPCNNLIITGGEPLAQQKDLSSFLSEAKARHPRYQVEFETNGTIRPSPDLDALTDQYNVSIKLSNSGVKEEDRLIPEAIQFFASSPNASFKFVVEEPADLAEILALVRQYNIPREAIYLMPQGVLAPVLSEKQDWLVEICKSHGFRYTDRLHIRIWGAKRGV
jgi:organic radical activating enzyme